MEHIDTLSYVKKEKQSIFDELEALTQESDDQVKKRKIDELFLRAEEVKKKMHQNLETMISYEIRVCNGLIKEIDTRISREREGISKKPFKFSFALNKTAANKDNKKPNSMPTENKSLDQVDSLPSISNESFGLKGLSNEERVLVRDEIDLKEIVLDSLTSCKVCLEGAPSVLRLINLRDCRIFSGPISSSVFISNCHGCTLHLVGQQLRIHDTSDCDIYQHVASRTIIEACTKLRFGPYNWKYHRLEEDFHKAGLDINVNNWTHIDDFDCLSNPSPNWSLID